MVSLAELYERTDWFAAAVDAEENTSIRDDFNAMAAGRQEHSVAILEQALAELPGAVAAAGDTTYVPWQDCSLATDDFLVVRLMEVVVHADDLAASVGLPTPAFDDDALHPALALLALLGARRHGQDAAVRALSRAERAGRAGCGVLGEQGARVSGQRQRGAGEVDARLGLEQQGQALVHRGRDRLGAEVDDDDHVAACPDYAS